MAGAAPASKKVVDSFLGRSHVRIDSVHDRVAHTRVLLNLGAP